jgi:hypothetical protein
MPSHALPKHIERALSAVFGEPVHHVRIVANSKYARLHGRAIATTRRNRILLRGCFEDFAANPRLLLHEYFRVVRQWQPGRLTLWRYVLESLRHGYQDNRFEVEAREFTAAHLRRFATLLRQMIAD